MSSPNAPAPAPVPAAKPFKRPKLKIAYQECRDRKVRCNGIRPVCNSCTRRRCPSRCLYEMGARGGEGAGAQASDYVKSFEMRLHEFEGRHAREARSSSQRRAMEPEPAFLPLESQPPSGEPAPRGHQQPTVAEGLISPMLSRPSYLPSTSRCDPAGQNSPYAHGSGADLGRNRQPVTNDMANTDGDNNSPSFLGSASAVGFMKEVYGSFHTGVQGTSAASVDTPKSSGPAFPATSTWFYDHGAGQGDIALSMEEFLLPPRRSADAFLHTYFDIIHHEMPVFHKPTFLQRYERLWTASPPTTGSRPTSFHQRPTLSDQLFHCMLAIIFALGCEFRPPYSGHNSSSNLQENFIKRATSLLNLDIITRPSLSLVQTLVLMARFLQHKGLPNRCWVIVGIAIRAAQGLGLHLDVDEESQVQREERRRTWSACVSLDRVQSMTFGRPLMLSNYPQVSLPQLIDDEYLETDPLGEDGHQPADMPPIISFFVYALKFSEINMDILKSFYSDSSEQNTVGDTSKLYATILDYDRRVKQYWEEIPSYLRYHRPYRPPDGDELFPRQSCLLYIRLLNTRIMVFRIALVRFATQPLSQTRSATTTLQWHLMKGCLDGCSSAAKDLIDLVHSNLGPNAARGFLPPAWYTTFLIYTAGTVLVVILRAPPLRNILPADQLDSMERSWTQCILVLEEFQRLGVPAAQKCIETLRKVHEDGEVDRQTRSGRGSPDAGGFGANINNTNQSHSESSRAVYQLHQNVGSESSISASNIQANSGIPETWWNSINIDWLNGLAELGPGGPIDPTNDYNEFVGFQ